MKEKCLPKKKGKKNKNKRTLLDIFGSKVLHFTDGSWLLFLYVCILPYLTPAMFCIKIDHTSIILEYCVTEPPSPTVLFTWAPAAQRSQTTLKTKLLWLEISAAWWEKTWKKCCFDGSYAIWTLYRRLKKTWKMMALTYITLKCVGEHDLNNWKQKQKQRVLHTKGLTFVVHTLSFYFKALTFS